MDVIDLYLKEIIPYVNNPRNNSLSVDKVAASIQEFGFKQPIVIDKENVIIVGHTRYLASQKLGLEKVPVVVASDLSPAQIKAYRVADNRVSEGSTWDNELLKFELEALKEFGFDLEILGMEKLEIENILADADFNPVDEDSNDRLDEKKMVICPNCSHEFEP